VTAAAIGVLIAGGTLAVIAGIVRLFITVRRSERATTVLAIHDQAEAILRDAIDLDLMDIALTTCDDCRFWNSDADRAEFLPCPAHEGLFTS